MFATPCWWISIRTKQLSAVAPVSVLVVRVSCKVCFSRSTISLAVLFVHTYPFSSENAIFPWRIGLPSTRIRWKRWPKTQLFENAFQRGNFWKLSVFVWTELHYYATFLFKTPLSTLQYASVNHTLYGKCVWCYRNWIELEGIRMAPNYPVNLRWRVIYWLVRGFRVVDVARILHVW